MSVERSYQGHSFHVVDPDTYPYGTNIFDDPEPILKLWNFFPGEIAVDVGASFGCFTCFALVLGADVLAFEPSSDGHRILAENVKLNNWQDRCTIHKVALYDGVSLPDNWIAEVFGIHYPATDVQFKSLDLQYCNVASSQELSGSRMYMRLESSFISANRTLIVSLEDG